MRAPALRSCHLNSSGQFCDAYVRDAYVCDAYVCDTYACDARVTALRTAARAASTSRSHRVSGTGWIASTNGCARGPSSPPPGAGDTSRTAGIRPATATTGADGRGPPPAMSPGELVTTPPCPLPTMGADRSLAPRLFLLRWRRLAR
eukprot:1816155-Pyramimonas_sp.AAC.1